MRILLLKFLLQVTGCWFAEMNVLSLGCLNLNIVRTLNAEPEPQTRNPEPETLFQLFPGRACGVGVAGAEVPGFGGSGGMFSLVKRGNNSSRIAS
jgi:hypothetical protein